MFNLRHFFPSNDKVRHLELHPTQPWLATSSKSDVVTIWDWSTRQVFQQYQLGAMGEEDMCGDADLARLHAKDPLHAVNPSVTTSSTSRSATGKVREVRFFDKDVAQTHLTTQHLYSTGPCRPAPNIQDASKFEARRLLVAVCDLKVLLYELGSKHVREVPKAMLEGKSAQCCAFLLLGGKASRSQNSPLLPSPVLALGCTDGIVRMLSLSTLKLVGRLAGPHKSPVVSMAVMGMRGGVDETILVAHEGGNVQRFAPSNALYKAMTSGGAPDIAPIKVTAKIHKDNIQSMAVMATAESPETTPGRIVVTCGADKQLVGFGPGTMQELCRIKLPSRESSLAFCPRGMTSSGTHTLFLGTDNGAVMFVHLESRSIRLAVDLNDLPTVPGNPNSKRPQLAVNCIAVHPLQPHLFAVAATSGSYVLQFKETAPPMPYVALPLLSPVQALASPNQGIEGAEVTYVVAVGDEVHCVTVSATQKELPLLDEPEPLPIPMPTPEDPSALAIAQQQELLQQAQQQQQQQAQSPEQQQQQQQEQDQQQPGQPGQQPSQDAPPAPAAAPSAASVGSVEAPLHPPPKKKGLMSGLLSMAGIDKGDKAEKAKDKEASKGGARAAASADPVAAPVPGKKEEKKESGLASMFGGSKEKSPPPPPPPPAGPPGLGPGGRPMGNAQRLAQRQEQQRQQQALREQRHEQQLKEQQQWQQQQQQQQQPKQQQPQQQLQQQTVPGAPNGPPVPGQPSALGTPGMPPSSPGPPAKPAEAQDPGAEKRLHKLSGLPGSPAVQTMSCVIMDTGRPVTRAQLGCSTDGAYVSVVWPAARQYTIYRQGAASWESVASGSGVDVAWGWNEHLFAVVEAAAPPPPIAHPAAGKTPNSKKAAAKEAEMRRANALAAEAAALAKPNTVQIMKLSERSVSGVAPVNLQGGDAPVRVTSGPLLGITTKKQLPDIALGGGVEAEAPLSFRLHTWTANSIQVGQEMPEPTTIAWDPTGILVALAYPAQVLLCSVTPVLEVLASLPLQGTVSIQWAMRQLFVLTQTHAYAACVTLPGTGPVYQGKLPVVQMLLEVAALGLQAEPTTLPSALSCEIPEDATDEEKELHLTWGGSAGGLGLREGPLPPTLPRPPGPLALLGPRGGVLWVGNVNAQALALPLAQHPVLHAISIAASGNVQGAIMYAKNELHPSHHGILASYLADGGGTGDKAICANHALVLPGLTLLEEAVLRIQLHHWPMAVEAVEALLAGFKRRPPLDSNFRFPATTQAFGSWSGAAEAAKANGGVPSTGVSAPLVATQALSDQPYEDDLDWMTPLRQAGTSTSARTAANAAATPALRSQPTPKEMVAAAPLGMVADLAIDLMRGLIGVGMHDAAQPLARLLIDHAAQLSPLQLSALGICMAEVDMRRELPLLLARSCVPGADALSRESVGLLAAVMSGHTSLINEVLRQTGAPALAAAQADWSKDEYNNETTVAAAGAEWVAQLAGQAHNMAPPTTPATAVPYMMIGKSSVL